MIIYICLYTKYIGFTTNLVWITQSYYTAYTILLLYTVYTAAANTLATTIPAQWNISLARSLANSVLTFYNHLNAARNDPILSLRKQHFHLTQHTQNTLRHNNRCFTIEIYYQLCVLACYFCTSAIRAGDFFGALRKPVTASYMYIFVCVCNVLKYTVRSCCCCCCITATCI